MWQYRISPRPDELYHAASKSGKQYKYIRKYKNLKGKWVYVYKKPGALTENHNQNAPTLGQRIGQIKSDLERREAKAIRESVLGPDHNNKGTSNFNKAAKKIVVKSNDVFRDKNVEEKAKDISRAFDEFVDLFKKNLKSLK